jgi:hypothetical protein
MKKIIYPKEVEAAWYVMKELIDPFNCSVQHDKKAIPMYYKDVLRHHYSGTKVFKLFGFSKAHLAVHLAKSETYYYRSKPYAAHFTGYGSSDKQTQSLSFAKELNIMTKRKRLYGAYVLLLGIDIDAHNNEPDVDKLADWLQTNYFPDSYWEPSTNEKGKHGYVKVAYKDCWNLEDVKLLIEELFDLLQLKIKKAGFIANIDIPCGLPVLLSYNNSVQIPEDLPVINLQDYSKYYHIREEIKESKAEPPEFLSTKYSYEEIDKIVNVELPVDIESTQCIKIPRFNRSDSTKANMSDIAYFDKLIYVDFDTFIKLRDDLKEELKLEPEQININKDISKKKEIIAHQGERGRGEDWLTIVGSPTEQSSRKSYQERIEDIRKIKDRTARSNKFYFYYSDYLGYVPDVATAIKEYLTQNLNSNLDKDSINRTHRFKAIKKWLDSKWDINKRGLNLKDWKDCKDKIISAVEQKFTSLNRTYTKDKMRKQIYQIPVEELAFVYFAILKSNQSDKTKKSTMKYCFSLRQVQQCLLNQFGKTCPKVKAVRIRQILQEAELISYAGRYQLGKHGNSYKAVDLKLEVGKPSRTK